SKGDIGLAAFFGNASVSSGKTPVLDANGDVVKDAKGNDVTKSIKNDQLSLAGAVVVNYAKHDVHAWVGDTATAADKADFETPGHVIVKASREEKTQLIAQSSVSKPGGSKGSAVALSLGVGIYDNTAEAIIRGNPRVDAGNDVTVSSTVNYPFLVNPEDLILGIPADI